MLNGLSGFTNLLTKLQVSTLHQSQSMPTATTAEAPQRTATGSVTDVRLSFEAKVLSAQVSTARGDWQKTVGANGILMKVTAELHSKAEDAELLNQMPSSDDPSRIELAKMASEYVVSGGGNPFSAVSRKTLSNIGFDESGAFTPAERFAAHLEISRRDGEFSSATSVLVGVAQRRGDNKAIVGIVTAANLQRLGGMSETEKSMYSYTEESLTLQLKELGDIKISVPSYDNLSDSPRQILAAMTDSNGKAAWGTISLNTLEDNNTSLALLSSLDGSTESSRGDNLRSGSWLTVYAQIGRCT